MHLPTLLLWVRSSMVEQRAFYMERIYMLTSKQMKVYMLNRYHERRRKAIQQLGGKCVKCKATEQLQFHHADPDGKQFTIARGASFSEERWRNEVAKCQLLCRQCHSEHHKRSRGFS